MNEPDTLKTIAAEIEATEKLYAEATGAVTARTQERSEIAAALDAARAARDAAGAALGDSLTRAELGEVGADEVAGARAALTEAAGALAKVCERDSGAGDAALIVAGLERRQVALAEKLRDLRARQHRERARALAAELHQRIGDYTDSALATIRHLASVIALDDYLNDMGAPQLVRPNNWGDAFLPGFLSHQQESQKQAGIIELLQGERDSLTRNHGRPAPLPESEAARLSAEHVFPAAPASRRMSKPPAGFTPGAVK